MADKIIGMIPAAGNAERFNGVFKELLPTGPGECGLSRCIDSMYQADADLIVLATEIDMRMDLQISSLESSAMLEFETKYFEGLWAFIAYVGKEYLADYYYFAMPDTVYPVDVFQRMPVGKAVVMGEFLTNVPYRFGIVWNNHIRDKSALPGTGKLYPAWGVWCWNRGAMEFLVDAMQLYKDHSLALDELIQRFGFVSVQMEYYYDFATFEDYKEFLCQSSRIK